MIWPPYADDMQMKVSVQKSQVGPCEERSDASDIGRNTADHPKNAKGQAGFRPTAS